MKAVVMAGGEGTRLRPMTSAQPKPLLPVANRPIMEHVLALLRRHGFTDTVVTVQFLAPLVRGYFGDGHEIGMRLQYATEETPLGTAGSVKNAEAALRDERFLVIGGDALTDIDLTELVRFHEEHDALVTVCLSRVPDPLEYGIVIADEDGRVERFLEKPTWGQVFSDTVSTGIYVMEPEVFDFVPAGRPVDWSHDVFPQLLARGERVFAHVAGGYWRDIGSQEAYAQAQADVLRRLVDVDIRGFELAPGVWVGEGAEIDEGAVVRSPVCIGDYTKVEAGAEIGELSVVGSNVVVRQLACLDRAVVHDNVYVGVRSSLRGCVVGRGTDVMRAARIEEGAVVGEQCVIGEEALVGVDVSIYPVKTIEPGALVHQSVIWESREQRNLFGRSGVQGIVNVEITPELAVRLASAYASTLKKGATVTVGRDISRASRTLSRAIVSALTSSALDVRDLELVPAPVTRIDTEHSSDGGIMLRTTAGVADSVDIQFLDRHGADVSPSAARRLERIVRRQEYRRAFPGEIGDLTYPPRVVENYAHELLRRVDVSGVGDAGLKIVVDTAGGAASLVLPTLLGRLGVDVLTLNARIDEARPTETTEERRGALAGLGSIVASSGAAFGVRFDPVAERIFLVDDAGRLVDDDRALLVVLDLVAAERRFGRVGLPMTTTRVAEMVAAFHGVQIVWASTAAGDLAEQAAGPGIVFAGDGQGGFVVPEFSTSLDGIAAFVRLLGLVARTQLSLSQIDARIPHAFLERRDVPTPWARKGSVMRAAAARAGAARVDVPDGVRVVHAPRAWVLVLPDPAEASTTVWTEGPDAATAVALAEEWAGVVREAGS